MAVVRSPRVTHLPATARVNAPANRLAAKPLDGFILGGDGRFHSPRTLSRIPPVTPKEGATRSERIIFINGIQNTPELVAERLQMLADESGHNVVGLYNQSDGWLGDLLQVGADSLNLTGNKATASLSELIYRQLRGGKSVHLAAHSQGALIAANALKAVRNRLLEKDSMSKATVKQVLSRVQVETFGGAARFYPDGPRYVHYTNQLDPVPVNLGVGTAPGLYRRGHDARTVRFFAASAPHDFATYLEHRVPFDGLFTDSSAVDGFTPA